ncbi:MAG: hypothetical protein WD939_08430, partial [Dehalococcoidia bacterium]
MSSGERVRSVRGLARLHGIQTSYYDTGKQRRGSPIDGLLRVVRALGVPVDGAGEVPDAARAWR